MTRGNMILACAILVLGLLVPAANAQSNWNLAGSTTGFDVFYQVYFQGADQGIWLHHMDILKMDMKTGVFSGTGYFVANGDYHWGIVTGVVGGDNMKYKVQYDILATDYSVEHTGKILADSTFKGTCTSSYNQTCNFWTKNTAQTVDTDGDGVKDLDDACGGTPAGAKVNRVGCSMTQLCPCAYWSNHGEYVNCLAKAKKEFVDAGLLTAVEAGKIQAAAVQSDCGRK